MRELTPENAAAYLIERAWLPAGTRAEVAPLAWGVSNVVMRVTPAAGEPLVLKQSRGQLRTRDPWFSRLDRIWREADVMRTVEPLLPRGVVPRVLHEEREDYVFVMEAAPAEHVVWKQRLLEGQADWTVAAALGTFLATIHRETFDRPAIREWFADTEVFVQLRVDPFYRKVAAACPEVREPIERMIEAMFASPVCLVHADFSPKNVLLAGERIVLVDFETGHYGDPAFDLGFFLSHLFLKTILHRGRPDFVSLIDTFWRSYRQGVASLASHSAFAPASLDTRMLPHLAGCLWARIDGTSKIDYLPGARDRELVREFSRNLLLDPPSGFAAALEGFQARLSRSIASRVAPTEVSE